MKNELFHSTVKIEFLAAILLVITIALGIAQQTLNREFIIDASTTDWTSNCSDDRVNGGKSFTEDLSTSEALSFAYTTQNRDENSFAVFQISPPEEWPLDLDWFSDISIRARAEGEDKQQFLVQLRDRPEHLDALGDPIACKYNEAFIELTEQAKTISLSKASFSVPRWWVAEKSVLPEDAAPSFSNVQWIEIAVFRPNRANSGVVVIEEISFRGPVISPINFYKFMFCIWSLLSIPLSIRLHAAMKKTRAIRRIRLNQVAQQESGSRADLQVASLKTKSPNTDNIHDDDELSGLPTGFGLRGAIDEALAAVRNGNAQASIILIDIDDFQRLNRTSGSAAGDKIIRQIASLLQENLPQGHKACRWSGDKFLVICHGKDRDESRKLACTLRKCIEEQTPVTCSLGVHQLNPINSFDEAYERAAKCVQEAKFHGKNRVVLFNLRSTSAPAPIINHDANVGAVPSSNLA